MDDLPGSHHRPQADFMGEKQLPPIENTTTHDLKDATIDDTKTVGTLERKLKSRHIQFLALSGAIGTGLFVGSGQVISLAGPLSAFLAYLITGFNLFCVINGLGEMATYLPVPGAMWEVPQPRNWLERVWFWIA